MSNMTERRQHDGTARFTAAGSDYQEGVQNLYISNGKLKTNRLRRSVKQSQQPPPLDSPNHDLKEFKTPTRPTRFRYTSGFNGESPLSDSDLQQDIIWDATSPSPIRADKRGKKKYPSAAARIVDISEIVNRIAPKHGRPVVPESSLQQWIGDSAIPCTPEVQQPKPKRKSPRQNGVDDLLKLAKQFDFNMFRQDEEQVQNMHEQSVELIPGDILDLDGDENKPPPVQGNRAPGNRAQPDPQTTSVTDCSAPLPPDQDMEDDMDILFDGPTQDTSANLSKNSLTQCLEARSTPSSKDISGKSTSLANGFVSHTVKHGSVHGDFDDDWENDDLLDDSIVLEMTQNPHHFGPPRHCSTQGGSNETKSDNNHPSTIASHVYQRSQQENANIQPSVSTRQEDVTKRKTFKLEANPHFQVNELLTEAVPNSEPGSVFVRPGQDRKIQQSQLRSLPTMRVVCAETGSQHKQALQHQSSGMNTRPKVPLPHQSTRATTSSNTLVSTNSCPMRTSQKQTSFDRKPMENTGTKEIKDATAFGGNGDIPDDDLDLFFASDDVWGDDGDDDDLMCEVCDDLESRVQSVEKPSVKCSQATNRIQTSAPAPSSCSGYSRETQPAQPRNPGISARSQSSQRIGGTYIHSLPNNGVSSKAHIPVATGYNTLGVNDTAGTVTLNSTSRPQNRTGKEPYPFAQAKSTYVAGSATHHQGLRTGARTEYTPPVKATESSSQFTFKRPAGCASYPAATSTSKGAVSTRPAGKCSAAEIELKKQQAMARRRQRMQATQNPA